MMHKPLTLAILYLVMGVLLATASESGRLKPEKQAKCPVCGMFVYKYPDWVSQVVFTDQSQFYFDGAKDLFKYVFRLETYNPGKTPTDIQTIWVTDYYDMTAIDGRSAFYVIGSDVFGPMGKELIPFAPRDAAQEFSNDHGGTAVLTYEQVVPAVIEKLD